MKIHILNESNVRQLYDYRIQLEDENCDTILINKNNPVKIETCERYINDKNAVLYGAFDDNNLIGFLNLDKRTHPLLSHTASLGLTVIKQFRNKGIGSKLLEICIMDALNTKLEIIDITVLSNNKAASLYLRHGFYETGRKIRTVKRNNYYIDEILMQKDLQSAQQGDADGARDLFVPGALRSRIRGGLR
jgi:ribosomal protein S18 acetylase RimI-like enzyme